MAGIRGVTLGHQRSLSSLLEVSSAQLNETQMKGGSHLMTPMTCCSALLSGLYREIFTESGPFFSLAQVSCVCLELLTLPPLWIFQLLFYSFLFRKKRENTFG